MLRFRRGPSFSRNRISERMPARPRARERDPGTGVTPRGHESAQIGNAEAPDVAECWRPAEMLRKEGQKLSDVARIGFDGLGRQTPFAAEMAAPAFDRLQRVARGSNQRRVGRLRCHCRLRPAFRVLAVKVGLSLRWSTSRTS